MAKKTNPKSLRFNEEHLVYALKETGIEKEQELIDKFLSDFFFTKNPSNNIFQNPVSERYNNNLSGINPEAGDMQKANKALHDSVLKNLPKISQFQAYSNEIMGATMISQIEMIVSSLKKDTDLNPIEKGKLELIAKEFSKTFEF